MINLSFSTGTDDRIPYFVTQNHKPWRVLRQFFWFSRYVQPSSLRKVSHAIACNIPSTRSSRPISSYSSSSTTLRVFLSIFTNCNALTLFVHNMFATSLAQHSHTNAALPLENFLNRKSFSFCTSSSSISQVFPLDY
jgi:hypothetical protein